MREPVRGISEKVQLPTSFFIYRAESGEHRQEMLYEKGRESLNNYLSAKHIRCSCDVERSIGIIETDMRASPES